ncbi:MAG: aspartyl protease family protein, partial [Gammaproteobacteria bacterium]|nr:aspartyl protease family protein [Gammaproteobacteria bacterium]
MPRLAQAPALCIALLVSQNAHPAAAASKCTLVRLPDIPVSMEGTMPIVHAQINGIDGRFLADSGSFTSMITPSAAEDFKMNTANLWGASVSGVGGSERI